MTRHFCLAVITLLALLLTGCAKISRDAPYRVYSDKSHGWTMQREGLKWVLTVPAEPGFGRLTLQPTSLSPSPDLVIHLPLTNLEQLTVSYNDRQLMAGFSRAGFFHETRCDSCARKMEATLRLVVIAKQDADGEPAGYDLYLPADYWKNDRGEVTIQWVDWLRL